MRYFFIVIGVIVILGIIFRDHIVNYIATQNVVETTVPVVIGEDITHTQDIENATATDPLATMQSVEVVAQNLTIPWDIAFISLHELLITERTGMLVLLNTETKEVIKIPVPGVLHKGEGGLLGIALHPQFSENQYLYLYLSSSQTEGAHTSVNKVIRYRFVDAALLEPETILDGIPGSLYHDGGRIAFGPDGYLYVTTGDAGEPLNAQKLDSLSGKILRATDRGLVPEDNPFPNSLVYAYGSRNAQGLTWDPAGNLWSTEHGRTNATQTGMDEVNRIRAGANYGWPESEGDTVLSGTVGPIIHSGPSKTWAPASALYWDGALFFGGLRGEALYEAVLDGERVIELREHFKGSFGRIRSVVLGPDGAFYLSTSNRDARGTVQEGDDKVIRINPRQFRTE